MQKLNPNKESNGRISRRSKRSSKPVKNQKNVKQQNQGKQQKADKHLKDKDKDKEKEKEKLEEEKKDNERMASRPWSTDSSAFFFQSNEMSTLHNPTASLESTKAAAASLLIQFLREEHMREEQRRLRLRAVTDPTERRRLEKILDKERALQRKKMLEINCTLETSIAQHMSHPHLLKSTGNRSFVVDCPGEDADRLHHLELQEVGCPSLRTC